MAGNDAVSFYSIKRRDVFLRWRWLRIKQYSGLGPDKSVVSARYDVAGTISRIQFTLNEIFHTNGHFVAHSHCHLSSVYYNFILFIYERQRLSTVCVHVLRHWQAGRQRLRQQRQNDNEDSPLEAYNPVSFVVGVSGWHLYKNT